MSGMVRFQAGSKSIELATTHAHASAIREMLNYLVTDKDAARTTTIVVEDDTNEEHHRQTFPFERTRLHYTNINARELKMEGGAEAEFRHVRKHWETKLELIIRGTPTGE